jgi:NADH-quinone oxidoreductase subunit C
MSDTPADSGAASEAPDEKPPAEAPGAGDVAAPSQSVAGEAPAPGVRPEAAAGSGAPADESADAASGDESSDGTPSAGSEPPTLLHGCPLDGRRGAGVVHCNRGDYLRLMTALKADGYGLPVGVTGVDYLTHPGRDLPRGIAPERFEVVVELLSLTHRRRVRVRCQVPAADPSVPTLFGLWPGTEAHERETYDMFGIRFEGHPDPSRILMPEDWEGHPLRKDYDTGHVPVQFKEAPK